MKPPTDIGQVHLARLHQAPLQKLACRLAIALTRLHFEAASQKEVNRDQVPDSKLFQNGVRLLQRLVCLLARAHVEPQSTLLQKHFRELPLVLI